MTVCCVVVEACKSIYLPPLTVKSTSFEWGAGACRLAPVMRYVWLLCLPLASSSDRSRSSFVRSGALAMFALVAGATLAFAQALPGQAVPIPPAAVGSGAGSGLGSGTTPAPAVVPANPVVAQTDPAVIAETNIRIERLEGEFALPDRTDGAAHVPDASVAGRTAARP